MKLNPCNNQSTKKVYKGRPDENKINPHEMYIYFALVKICNTAKLYSLRL